VNDFLFDDVAMQSTWLW